MIRVRKGEVLEVRRSGDPQTEPVGSIPDELVVRVEGKIEKALNFPRMTGSVAPGDRVLLNTTASWLNLGSGGYHFVIWVEGRERLDARGPGHIMKLRYTPLQVRVLAAEEQESPFHQILAEADDLGGAPVLAGELHSQVGPALVALGLTTPAPRVAYVMTDGGALPLGFSRLVRRLLERNLMVGTVTAGHAFGGDLEATNLYSALLAARVVHRADVIIAAMGPGIAGTGTRFGFTGVEQGQIINAAGSLGGTPICIPRLSFTDPRERHSGISHHTQTVLSKVALVPCYLPIPGLPDNQARLVAKQLEGAGLRKKHKVIEIPAPRVGEALRSLVEEKIEVTHMGRGLDEDPAFFAAAAGAGLLARELWQGGANARVNGD